MPGLEDLFAYLDTNGDGRASVTELVKSFYLIDRDGDGVLTPVEMHKMTSKLLDKLCSDPGFKAYFASKLTADFGAFYG